jgi:hypothetical protein
MLASEHHQQFITVDFVLLFDLGAPCILLLIVIFLAAC